MLAYKKFGEKVKNKGLFNL